MPSSSFIKGLQRQTPLTAPSETKGLFGALATLASVPAELHVIARKVRRIDDGYSSNPESILLFKEGIAERIIDIARRLEAAITAAAPGSTTERRKK